MGMKAVAFLPRRPRTKVLRQLAVVAATTLVIAFNHGILFTSLSYPGHPRPSEKRGRVVRLATADEELEVWREAYGLENDRAELLEAQLQDELSKLGKLSAELKQDFEGCMVEEAPGKPESNEADLWSEAYLGLKRCNDQLELRINEIKATSSEKLAQKQKAFERSVRMDLGPIRHKGIRFKDQDFDRYSLKTGSTFYFVELPLPLGVQLD